MALSARRAKTRDGDHRGRAAALPTAAALVALVSLFIAGPELISPAFDPAPLHRVLGGWLIAIGFSATLSAVVLYHARIIRSRREPASAREASRNTNRVARVGDAPGCVELEEELERIMAEDRLYTDPDLTLRDLADSLGETRHRVSRCLNGHIGNSFYDYMARRRIRHAEHLLREHPEQSILDVAFASGFSSKATFNRQFKEMTGRSPSTVRAAVEAAAHASEP